VHLTPLDVEIEVLERVHAGIPFVELPAVKYQV
jgi:hypothetical protein